MNAILAVARGTFREAVRDRVLFLVLGFGAVILALSRLLAPIALGEAPRITVDLGLSALGMIGIVIVVLVGTQLVHKEIERRTIHVVLSRPVSRSQYLVGKWAGLTATMAVAVAGMTAMLIAIGVMVQGPAIVGPIVQAAFMIACANSILAALAVLFSSLSTPVLSMTYTLGLYATGFWTNDLRTFAVQMSGGVGALVHGASYLIPNLELFNLRSQVAHGEGGSVLHLALAIGYAGAYVAAGLSVAVIAFDGRELMGATPPPSRSPPPTRRGPGPGGRSPVP
jgi:ABC-type transport system involved in multi-copper enzyme maturation permease subunit